MGARETASSCGGGSATDKIIALKHRLEELLSEVELYVFGSRARGDFYPDSDVDLAIVAPDFNGKDELERYDLIREDLRDILGATPVDVVLYTPAEFEEGTDAFLPPSHRGRRNSRVTPTGCVPVATHVEISPLVVGGIGTPCNGKDCEFSPGGVNVSCPAATGPDSLQVNETGIMTGTCSDGVDNDCDGKVGTNDAQCGLVQNCSKSSEVTEECAGQSGDLSGDNVEDGYYCDNTTVNPGRCCGNGTYWDGTECAEPFSCTLSCSESNFSNQWWSLNDCVQTQNNKTCVGVGIKYGMEWKEWQNATPYSK